jgi:hypothetical protein
MEWNTFFMSWQKLEINEMNEIKVFDATN